MMGAELEKEFNWKEEEGERCVHTLCLQIISAFQYKKKQHLLTVDKYHIINMVVFFFYISARKLTEYRQYSFIVLFT